MEDKTELDNRNRDRVKEALNRIQSGDDDAFGDLVLSERVYNDLDIENIVLPSFNLDAVKSYLPYSDRIYVMVCPNCIRNDNINDYKKLVETGSIVPVLGSSYSSFDDEFVDITYSHNHVGGQEYFALRSLFAGGEGYARVCAHCVEERSTALKAQLLRKKLKGFPERSLNTLMMNLHPYIEPDFELLDKLEEMIVRRDSEGALSIMEMGWTLSQMRSANIFNSPVVISGTSYQQLPTGYSDQVDQTQRHAVKIQKTIGDGLGIQIPDGLELSQYIELASDFRPRIQALIQKIEDPSDSNKWQGSLDKEIINLNQEAAKLSKSMRYIALAAVVEFYKNNQIKLNTALVAASMSLGASALGCGVTAIAGTAGGAVLTTAATGIAGSRGWIGTGPAIERATRTFGNAVQPHIDSLIAKYVGSSPMAVSILSLKKDIGAAT
ncbi:hypothetical protein IFJ75_17405 [Brevundimonas goettingensis]|uniref:Uncharacterized protein n=1 Tax=Brevundimonas goettingensis TaxID=2774190 RepID=A0A975C143_9CAUL|nr:hypothetical protein IFJ75_17405 [Brevundimonas goettingensis]